MGGNTPPPPEFEQRASPKIAPGVQRLGSLKMIPYRNLGDNHCDRWPDEVARSELNLPKWRSLVEFLEIGGDAPEVFDGCEAQFHQGIPQKNMGPLKWFTPNNHESAILAEEKVKNTLGKEKRALRIFGPFTHEQVYNKIGFFQSNPMCSVINGDGSFRIINDLSFLHDKPLTPSVNSFVKKKEFETSWDDFNTVIWFFKRNNGDLMLALFDWEKAYRQIATHPSQWRYLVILDLYNWLCMDTRVQFGGVAGCGVFGRPADLWRKIIVKFFKLELAFRWVDDNLLVKEISNHTTITNIVGLSDKMGVSSNPEKVHDFADEQEYIGFIWNAR